MPERVLGDKGGLSRRQLLARGAVAAGVAWAAPIIRTSTAYAAASDGTERPATRFFVCAIDASNQSWAVFPDGHADLPGDWQPEAVGNGWPEPWDGQGEPPWGQTSKKRARSRVYTYNAEAVTAGPGQSISFGREDAVDPSLDGDTVDGAAVDDATVAADDPEMPDADQFAQRIGADLPDPLPPPVVDWVYANPGIELEAPDRRPALSQVGDSAWACLLPAPPALPDWWSRRYRLVLGCYKDGNYFGDNGYDDPNPPSSELGRRVLFPTNITRVGGYAGHSGRPGRAGPDQVNTDENRTTRVGGPGSAVPTETGDPPTLPSDPAQPGDPNQPDLPGSMTSTSTTTTTRPGSTAVWDPTTCTPDPKAPFPWNLKYPDNFIVAWYGPRFGLKIPKAPKSACLPPPPDEDPQHPKKHTSSTTTPTTASPLDGTDEEPAGDDPDAATTTTTTTTTTSPPAAAAAPAPQAPTTEIRHAAGPKATKKVHYSHAGHLGDHECIVLVYCRP